MTSHDPLPSHVFYRKLTRHYPRIVRGDGCWLYDDRGPALPGRVGGAFVVNVGHGVREIAAAMGRQAERLAYVNGTAFTHDPVEEFAAEIARRSPGDLDLVYPLASGSEAVEAALKLARQYWVEAGRAGQAQDPRALRPPITATPCWRSRPPPASTTRPTSATGWSTSSGSRRPTPTAATAAARRRSARAAAARRSRRRFFAKGPRPSPRSSPSRSAAPRAARRCRRRSTGARVRAACDRHGILLIADEVLTGAGRTGTWSALEPYGVVPDIMTLGKGIAGGYVPLSAVVAPRRLADVLAQGSGALLHAQTFSHHATLCAAGVATLRYLREHALIERCAAIAPAFHAAARGAPRAARRGRRPRPRAAGGHRVRGGPGHPGAVSPRRPASPRRSPAAALEAGLVVWPNVGPGRRRQRRSGDAGAAFIVTHEEIDLIVQRFGAALRATVERIGAVA